ncbi:MAG: F0F1 ATP synthase subunit alpha, partial [Erysipelotrichaceae bacterium]|nr:F0F1 ATP synthase subunit alpha [Erysipelotrichaceae bacterium]
MKAVLYSAKKPSEKINKKFEAFLNEKYGEVELEWQESDLKSGFKLLVGDDVYYWDANSKFEQLKTEWQKYRNNDNIIPLLQDSLDNWTPNAIADEVGRVISVGDGIAKVSGLKNVKYGEILLFTDNIRGMVLDLKQDSISCILFGDDRNIIQGSIVKRTNKTAGIPVGEEYIGRVIDALGNPIDDKGAIHAKKYMPLEQEAPSIMDRSPVNRPLETGILAIDSMFPIGKGQREL